MKNIFKQTIISLVILLSGCEAEKESVQQHKIIVRPFSMKSTTAKSNSKLSQAVSNIRKIKTNTTTDGNSSKLVFDEKAGLYFDDEKGLYIEKDNLKSYTFPVIRTSANEKIKNICFNEKPNGNYDVFLVKYDLTKEEVLNLTEEQKALREKQFVALMKDGVNVDSFRFQCVNITLTTTTEYAAPLDNGDLTGNFGYTTGSHTTTVIIGSSCYFDNGSSGGGFNQGVGSNGSYNSSGATGSGNSSNTQSGSDIITGLNTQDFGNSLTDGELFYYNYTDFMSHLNEEQKAFLGNHSEFINYLVTNYWSNGSKQLVMNIIGLSENTFTTLQSNWIISHLESAENIINHLNLNNYSEESINEIKEAINTVSNNGNIEEYKKKGILPPSCEAFEYTNLASANWQVAATKNIVALIGYYDIATGEYNTANIIFTQPIYFGMPKVSAANGGEISSGKAAKMTARALATAIQRTTYYFLSTSGTNSQVRAKFWDYLRDEMANGSHVVGGSASLTPPNGFNGQIKDYETYWFYEDDCE